MRLLYFVRVILIVKTAMLRVPRLPRLILLHFIKLVISSRPYGTFTLRILFLLLTLGGSPHIKDLLTYNSFFERVICASYEVAFEKKFLMDFHVTGDYSLL